MIHSLLSFAMQHNIPLSDKSPRTTIANLTHYPSIPPPHTLLFRGDGRRNEKLGSGKGDFQSDGGGGGGDALSGGGGSGGNQAT